VAKTSRRTWQKSEERAAQLFNSHRQAGSGAGSSGRDDQTASDSTHQVLFIESKLRDRHAVRSLHDAAKKSATKERKVPILALFDKNREGFLVCIHSEDFRFVVAQYLASLDPDGQDELDYLVEKAKSRGRS
jgi:hypothetical protein